MTRQWVSQYTITALPEDASDRWYGIFEITVDRAPQSDGVVLWAVRWHGRCINRRGEWSFEPIPSSRTDRWLKAHRFDLEAAPRLAEKAAPKLTINGVKAADAS